MILVTAVKNTEHVTPLQDAMLYRGITGEDTAAFNRFEKFEPQVISNNEVRIRSGIGMIQGRVFCIEPNTYDAVIIANGTQGMKRIDIIAVKFTDDPATGTQNAEWEVIQGTPHATNPASPQVPSGNIDAGDTEAYAGWIKVTLNGINITGVSKEFKSAIDYSISDAEYTELMA